MKIRNSSDLLTTRLNGGTIFGHVATGHIHNTLSPEGESDVMSDAPAATSTPAPEEDPAQATGTTS
jgi:hypothetical protein